MSEQNTANPLGNLSDQLEGLIQVAAGAVVSVGSHGRAVASGLLWKPGVVVTASDAVESDDGLAVSTAGAQSVPAQLAGRDPTTAIAVLRLADDKLAPPPLTVQAEVRVGQLVVAVGRSSEGVIANLGMVAVAGPAWQSRRGGTIDRLVRLDLRLNPRAEGGIVVDGDGRLVGMAVFGPRRRPLVIPPATIERIAPRLLAEGRIQRGYLGVSTHAIRLDEALAAVHALPDRRALMVAGLDPEGPARKAGVLIGDVIVSLDGAAVPGMRALIARLTPEMVGKSVDLRILRAGQMTTSRVTIGASPGP